MGSRQLGEDKDKRKGVIKGLIGKLNASHTYIETANVPVMQQVAQYC